MKRNIIRTVLAVLFISALVQACQKMEPSTYTENFYRIASVQCRNDRASLLIDYTGESFVFSNFQTAADMDKFKVKNGDRVLVNMSVSAVGNMYNNKLTVEDIYKLPVDSIAQERPSDTLNYDYRFNVFYLIDLKYPAIWSQGHYVNLAPIYYVPSEDSKAEFHLYPLEVKADTLVMRLYSDIPDNNLAIRGYASASQSFLCYDMSSLRDSVADPTEHAHRKELLQQLRDLNRDSIMVHIYAPDTLRGTIESSYYERYPNVSVSISIPLDF